MLGTVLLLAGRSITIIGITVAIALGIGGTYLSVKLAIDDQPGIAFILFIIGIPVAEAILRGITMVVAIPLMLLGERLNPESELIP